MAAEIWANLWWVVFGAAVSWLAYWLIDWWLRGGQGKADNRMRSTLSSAQNAATQHEGESRRLADQLQALQLDHHNQTDSFALLHASSLEKDKQLTADQDEIARLKAQLAGSGSASADASQSKAELEAAQRAATAHASDIARLKSDLAAAQIKLNDLDKTRADLVAANKSVAGQGAETAKVRADLSKALDKIAELETVRHELEGSVRASATQAGEINSLKTDLAATQSRLADTARVRDDLDAARQSIAARDADLHKIRAQLSEALDKADGAAKLRMERDDSRALHETAGKSLALLQNEHQAAKSAIATHVSDHARLKGEHDKLHKELELARKVSHDEAATIVRLKAEVEAERKKAEEAADKLRAELVAATSAHEAANKSLGLLQTEHGAVKSAASIHASDHAKLRGEHDKLHKELELARKVSHDEAATIVRLKAELATERAKGDEANAKLRAELASAKSAHEATTKSFGLLQTEHQAAKSAASAHAGDHAKLRGEHDKLHRELEQARKVSHDEAATIVRLKAEVEAERKKADEAAGKLRAELATAKSAHETASKSLGQLQTEHQAAKSAASAHAGDHAKLKGEHDKLHKELELARKVSHDEAATIVRLKAEVEGERKKADETAGKLRTELASAKSAHEATTKSFGLLQTEHQAAKSAASGQGAELSKTKTEFDKARHDLEAAHKAAAAHQAEIAKVRADHEKARHDLEAAHKAAAAHQADLAKVKVDHDKARHDLEAARKVAAAHQADLARVRADHEKARHDLEAAHQATAAHQADLAEAKSDLAATHAKAAEAEADRARLAAASSNADKASALGFKPTKNGADDLEIIEGIGPKIAGLLHAAGIESFAQLAGTPVAGIQAILDRGGSRFALAKPASWPQQAKLCAEGHWTHLKTLQDELIAGVKRNDGPAGESGFKPTKGGKDDLTIIEGIGPKIDELLAAAGITTFHQLSRAAVGDIQAILDKAGPHFAMAKPATWPRQAGLCAQADWAALRKLQDELTGGVKQPVKA